MKRPISWFIDLYHGGQLDLAPPYQRRSVWTLKDRKFFIDTIFRKYPCPAVFLHKDLDEKSGKMIYHVIDGKQRIETILSFVQNSLAVDPGYGDRRLDGKKWKAIESEMDIKDRFLNYDLAIEYIDTNDKQFINGVFDRLNRTSRKLERQELRHARYEGWFIATAEAEAEKEEWERLGVVTKARMRRMKDVQYISELLMVLLKGRISGYNQDAIDTIYADYDSPLETLPDFDESNFLNRLDMTKGYIIQMEYHNSAITKNVRGFADFYSLWAFVALNQDRLPSPEITAERYAEFMREVIALAKAKDGTLSQNYEDNANVYLKNSIQSSTDYSQRASRHKALDSVLLKGSEPERVLAVHNGANSPSLPVV
jgi:Protein of unknown function DUF262